MGRCVNEYTYLRFNIYGKLPNNKENYTGGIIVARKIGLLFLQILVLYFSNIFDANKRNV